MPAAQCHYSEDDKVDILSLLQEYGVEYIVYKILHKLQISDICSAFQVCSSWNSWDNDYFWARELQSALSHREELRSVTAGAESPKTGVQTVWRLGRAWRLGRNTRVTAETDSSVLSAALTTDGSRVICGLNSGEVAELQLRDGAETRRKEAHSKGVRAVAVAAAQLVTASYDGSVKCWAAADWRHLRTLVLGVAVTDLAFTAAAMFVTGDEGVVACYSWDSLASVWAVSGGEMVNCVAVWGGGGGGGGGGLVTGTDAGQLSVRSLHTGQIEQSLLGHERGCGISGLAVTSLGLWSASFDCRVRLWGEGGACLAVLIGHTHPVRCLAADRGRLVSGDYRGFVMIWDAEDVVRELDTFSRKRHSAPSGRGTGSGIYRLEGRQVVMSGGETCEVHQHNSLLEHRGNVTAVVLSGAAVLVSASRDRTVNIHTFSGQPQPAPARKSYL